MTALKDIWRGLTSLPSFIQGAAIIALALPLLFAWDGHRIASAEQRGADRVLARARVDSIALKASLKAAYMARTKTDTVLKVVTAKAKAVDSAAIIAAAFARQLPPALDTIPAVQELRGMVIDLSVRTTELAADVDSLTRTLDAERATHRMAVDVAVAQLAEANMVILAKTDTITTLERRPTWHTVAKVAVVAPLAWEAAKWAARTLRVRNP